MLFISVPDFSLRFQEQNFPMQQISEEIQKMKLMHVTLHCSNAVDFAGLRTETSKSLEPKNFCWKNLFMVFRHQVGKSDFADQFDYYAKINLEGHKFQMEEIQNFLDNGPFLPSLYPSLQESTTTNLIHSTFFPYQTILDGINAKFAFKIPAICILFSTLQILGIYNYLVYVF